jgi:undecaprenyl diphosphate synthase
MHVAIIMDGNRRWAKARGMPIIDGHRSGIKNALEIVSKASGLGITHMTFWVFSTENWNRSIEEVNGLMSLYEYYLKTKSTELVKQNIKVQFIGNFTKVSSRLKECMRKVEEKSKNCTGIQLFIALSYSGRTEMVDAAKKLASEYKSGICKLEDVDENYFRSLLYAPDAPYPDLLIRTSGEIRISNFMLWELAYAEFYFTKTLWPDFSEEELKTAVAEFQSRERRYGQ